MSDSCTTSRRSFLASATVASVAALLNVGDVSAALAAIGIEPTGPISPQEFVEGLEAEGFQLWVWEGMDPRFPYIEWLPMNGRPEGSTEREIALRARARRITKFSTYVGNFLWSTGRVWRG